MADGAPSTAVTWTAPRRAVASGGAATSRTRVRRPGPVPGVRPGGAGSPTAPRGRRPRGGREREPRARPVGRAVSFRVRRGGGRSHRGDDGRRRFGPRDRARVPRKPVPDSRHGGEEAGSVLPFAQRPPHDEDGLRQSPVADDDVGPHRPEELLPQTARPAFRTRRRGRRTTSEQGRGSPKPGKGDVPEVQPEGPELVQVAAFERVDRQLRGL